MKDSSFMLNEAGSRGGAIFAYADSRVDLRRSKFLNNRAESGGALSITTNYNAAAVNYKQVLDECVLSGNNATLGGAIEAMGEPAIVVRSSQLSRNSADDSGGGMYFYDGAVLEMEGSAMLHNTARVNGGSCLIEASAASLLNVFVLDSTAGENGGGIHFAGKASTGTVIGSTFGRCNATKVGWKSTVFDQPYHHHQHHHHSTDPSTTTAIPLKNGGCIAVDNDVDSLTIDSTDFNGCLSHEQGGAVHASGETSLVVSDSSFTNCEVP